MCTFEYAGVAKAIEDPMIRLNVEIPVRFHPRVEKPEQHSKSSMSDPTWLGAFPQLKSGKGQSTSLPKFTDFEYVGRLADGLAAQVYCVRHIPSKEYVAIKVAEGSDEEARHQLEVERQILFRYSDANPYMIKAYCSFHHGVRLRAMRSSKSDAHGVSCLE